MKILQIIPYFYPAWSYGGPVRVAYELSKRLVERGHEVSVYTTDTKDRDSRLMKVDGIKDVDGIKVYYFRNINKPALKNYPLFITPSMIPTAKKQIQNFDVVHLHEYRSFQNIVVHHYAKKYGVPYVLQAHGSVLPFFQKQRLKRVFDMLFGYKILKNASKVIAISKAEVEQYKQADINEDKIVTVPNGIDIEAFKDLPTYGKFREKYDIKEDYMILFLGRIHKRKGISFLIKSFSELTREMSDVVLVIIGSDDGYKVEAEKLITTLNLNNRIKIIGYVDEKDKLSAYVDADVLVYPAIFEIFGLVPFEAIMCGTPVIVTDDCGCGELVEESGAGYLVEYGDIEGLKEKMKRVIENPEEGKERVETGKQYINENLAWDKVVEMCEEVYRGWLI